LNLSLNSLLLNRPLSFVNIVCNDSSIFLDSPTLDVILSRTSINEAVACTNKNPPLFCYSLKYIKIDTYVLTPFSRTSLAHDISSDGILNVLQKLSRLWFGII